MCVDRCLYVYMRVCARACVFRSANFCVHSLGQCLSGLSRAQRRGVLTYKMGMYVLPYIKKKGAYGADQTETVGAFIADRTVKIVPLELIELGKMGALRKRGCF